MRISVKLTIAYHNKTVNTVFNMQQYFSVRAQLALLIEGYVYDTVVSRKTFSCQISDQATKSF